MANTPHHILEGLSPDGESFPHQVPNLIRSLGDRLGVALADVDVSLEGLERVEAAVRHRFTPIERADGSILLPLVAYVSEIGRRQVDGRISHRPSVRKDTWEPWVVGADGNEYEFFTLAYEQFCDVTDETASAVGALVGRVRASALMGMVEKAAQPQPWPISGEQG